MTPKDQTTPEDKHIQHLDEICENTRAIRRVANRILDHLHEYGEKDDLDYDPDAISWEDLNGSDDMYL